MLHQGILDWESKKYITCKNKTRVLFYHSSLKRMMIKVSKTCKGEMQLKRLRTSALKLKKSIVFKKQLMFVIGKLSFFFCARRIKTTNQHIRLFVTSKNALTISLKIGARFHQQSLARKILPYGLALKAPDIFVLGSFKS